MLFPHCTDFGTCLRMVRKRILAKLARKARFAHVSADGVSYTIDLVLAQNYQSHTLDPVPEVPLPILPVPSQLLDKD